MTEGTFRVIPPSAAAHPVVVHVPHASTVIPDEVRTGILLTDEDLAAELHLITDHRTDVLVADVGAFGATRFVNRRSRLVVDPERFPDPDREIMERRGMGAVYTATTDRRSLRTDDAAERRWLLDRYFHPYANALAAVVSNHLASHGVCTIVDVHSYPSRRLPYEVGGDERPDVCVGTDAVHTPAWLRDVVHDVANDHGFVAQADTPFSGTYVPEVHYGVDRRVHSVMLEIRRDNYLDERTARPHPGEQRVRSFVRNVVEEIVRQPRSG